MTVSTASPTADLAALREATDRLLATVDTLDEAAVGEPSLLPGWSRGHLLAHLARNADALVNVLTGRPMYPSEEARDAEIARDADRPLAEHRADLRESAARLAEAAESLTDEQWRATVTFRGGVTDRAATVPFRRWVEVELHHLDLGVGGTVASLPGVFLDRVLDYLAARFANPALDVPPIELRAEDGRSWRTGAEPGQGRTTTVAVGTPAALVGWLTGRTTGSGLTTTGGEPLPTLPPL
ncbi:maleylpyruvate isomerase family mycothiol-dependent enzyme [Streptomyces sp. 4N509B]|uniref:maleylpyruvate isomerase family mycothiol-dependent enzyme n=1 Tax=Streptomyces sp. 4N509B TaxID=3457413 RepID=UPI003FD1B00C